eukprot:366238-Chlamydomonas_euryale.AAC.11
MHTYAAGSHKSTARASLQRQLLDIAIVIGLRRPTGPAKDAVRPGAQLGIVSCELSSFAIGPRS